VNGADVGVVQSRRRLGLSSKSLNRGGTSLGLRRKKFQRNHALQAGVFRFVHYPHAATTQPFDDAVVRNDVTNHKSGPSLPRMLGRASSQVNAPRNRLRNRLAIPNDQTRMLLHEAVIY